MRTQAIDRTLFIMQELGKAGIIGRPDEENIAILCPFHSETAPSLYIHKSGTAYHCFGCKKSGNWNDIAEFLKLTKIDLKNKTIIDEPDSEYMTVTTCQLVDRSIKNIVKPVPARAWKGNWRGLSQNFLLDINSFLWFEPSTLGYRIVWPINTFKKTRGWLGASVIKGDISPKYRNFKGLSSTKELFPVDYVCNHFKNLKTIVLVEGPFDAMRLISNGIPALCILGTANWKSEKSYKPSKKIPILLAMGIENILCYMDGDDAGREANELIFMDTSKFFNVAFFPLPEGKDPGDADIEIIQDMVYFVDVKFGGFFR